MHMYAWMYRTNRKTMPVTVFTDKTVSNAAFALQANHFDGMQDRSG
jgi:hypothetical protein